LQIEQSKPAAIGTSVRKRLETLTRFSQPAAEDNEPLFGNLFENVYLNLMSIDESKRAWKAVDEKYAENGQVDQELTAEIKPVNAVQKVQVLAVGSKEGSAIRAFEANTDCTSKSPERAKDARSARSSKSPKLDYNPYHWSEPP
jgi:hypothetical protein